MSKNSGVQGKTVPQLARAIAAGKRMELRELRRDDEQLGLLALRPGQSRRERARLNSKGRSV